MRFDRFETILKCSRTLCAAALALAAAIGFAAPAAAAPAIVADRVVDAPAGVRIGVDAESSFSNAGTNPRITDAVFDTTDYHNIHEVVQGRLFVRAKTAAQLNALETPPPSPFEVDVTITMTNDENETASGTITFKTTYARIAAQPPPPPSFTDNPDTIQADPGVLVSAGIDNYFDNAGAGAAITSAEFATTEYYSRHTVLNGQVWVQAKTAAELNALATPPDSPFEVDVTVTMTNSAGQTATGTITFRTTYTRTGASAPQAQAGAAAAPAPTFKADPGVFNAPPDTIVSIAADSYFDNPGAGAAITSAVFSTTEYYKTHEVSNGRAWVTAKTHAQLNALSPRPPATFDVNITVTMTNDAGQTASGTITARTSYQRNLDPGVTPVAKQTGVITVPSRPWNNANIVTLQVRDLFDDVGPFARMTGAVFSTTDYYNRHSLSSDGQRLRVEAKTNAQLNALGTPPPSPFTVTATVTMTNSQNHTATGTFTLQTTYARNTSPPSFKTEPSVMNALPGILVSGDASSYFDNAGAGAVITSAVFSTTDYYSSHQVSRGRVWVQAKTTAQLNAMNPRPPEFIDVDITLTMTNDRGQTASGTITARTFYHRNQDPGVAPVAKQTGTITVPNSGFERILGIRDLFDDVGPHARMTAATFSTTNYYRRHQLTTYGQQIRVLAKTDAQLNALGTPPPSPFTVSLTVTMTNSENQTATGTFTLQTTWTPSGQGAGGN